MYCPKCGAELKEGSQFCGKCGASIGERLDNSLPMPKSDETSNVEKRIDVDAISQKAKDALCVATDRGKAYIDKAKDFVNDPKNKEKASNFYNKVADKIQQVGDCLREKNDESILSSQQATTETASQASDGVVESNSPNMVENTDTSEKASENRDLTEQEIKKKRNYIWGTCACAIFGTIYFLGQGGFSLKWWWWIALILLILLALGAYGSQDENKLEDLDAAKGTLSVSVVVVVLMTMFMSPYCKDERLRPVIGEWELKAPYGVVITWKINADGTAKCSATGLGFGDLTFDGVATFPFDNGELILGVEGKKMSECPKVYIKNGKLVSAENKEFTKK